MCARGASHVASCRAWRDFQRLGRMAACILHPPTHHCVCRVIAVFTVLCSGRRCRDQDTTCIRT